MSLLAQTAQKGSAKPSLRVICLSLNPWAVQCTSAYPPILAREHFASSLIAPLYSATIPAEVIARDSSIRGGPDETEVGAVCHKI